jgi:hypothetical protein
MDTLFAYTLEEQEGRLVITVQGSFAEAVLRQLRNEITTRGGLHIISRLSPIVPLGRLLSSAKVRLTEEQNEAADGDALDTDDLLNQSVDQTFGAFQQQLNEFREALDSYKAGTRAAQAPAAARRGRKTARKAAAATTTKRARR